MKKNKIKKIITISAVVLLMIATLGTFAVFFGKSDFAKVKDTIKDTIVREEETKENVNIVSNSNFKINTVNTESGVFTEETNANLSFLIDDWKINSGSGSVDYTSYQVDNGLYMRNEGEDSFCIAQVIEEGINLYANKIMTIAISIDGIVYTATGVLTENQAVTVYGGTDRVANMSIFMGNASCSVAVHFAPEFNSIVNWIHVEEGNVFTGYVPPVVA